MSKGPRRKDANGSHTMQGITKDMGGLSMTSNQLSLFPAKPVRQKGIDGPGKKVRLVTNLFRLSIRENKCIHQYAISINRAQDEAAQSVPGDKTTQKNLPSELRQSILKVAIDNWVKSNKSPDYNPKLKYNWVCDHKISHLFTLFDMFPGKGSDAKNKELQIDYEERPNEGMKKYILRLDKCPIVQPKIVHDYCLGKLGNCPYDVISETAKAINAITRGAINSADGYVLTANNVFPFRKENQFPVSAGVIANKGFFTSARPTESGLVINIANTVAAFYEEIDLVSLLQKRFRVMDLNRSIQPNVIVELKKEIFNKQVEARHKNYGTRERPHYRKYRVTDIGESGNSEFIIADREKKTTETITIANYFLREYKIKLKYPLLPCVIDKGRKIPMELCYIVEKQRVARKMTPDETSIIIKQTAIPADQHFKNITRHVDTVQRHSGPIKDFGLELDPKPIEVEGRELDSYVLLGGSKRDIFPRDGAFRADREKFFKPATVEKWALTFLVDDFVKKSKRGEGKNALGGEFFSKLYTDEAISKGVRINQATDINEIPFDARDSPMKLVSCLKNYFKYLNKQKMDHSLFVLPRSTPDFVYRCLQYLEAITKEGRGPNEKITRISCLKFDNYIRKILESRDKGKMFLANLWLKYNTKLGGINFVLKPNQKNLEIVSEGTIFISVDVCHPAPGDKLIQSVAAVVAMWDLSNEKFCCSTRLRVQPKQRENHSTIEEVIDIDQMVGQVLETYREKKSQFPSKVVILRDGVSEGQYKIVLEKELVKVKQILSNKYNVVKAKPPLLSCLVVQKRHKVRFRRVEPHKGFKGDDYNIQPGTVVDNGITHPRDFSFYLAPHKAIQGTSRAPHVYMIYDEIKFSQDQAQAMILALSHLSPRCTKTTSIPTPVNLADLAAERGKNLVICWVTENGGKMNEKDRLNKLNEFLLNIGDKGYKNTLFYI